MPGGGIAQPPPRRIMIHQLLYTSQSRYPRGHRTDLDILHEAVNRNRWLGISGYLLRERNGFCQVLEGDEANVRDLFRRIRKDRRHFQVIQRMSRTADVRDFDGWRMGYASLSDQDSRFLNNRLSEGDWGQVVALDSIRRLARPSGRA